MRNTTSAIFGLLTLAGAVRAAELPPALETCTTLRRDAERLLCYDKAVAQIRSGVEGAPAPSAENMFGANRGILDSTEVKADVKREELSQISGTVTSVIRADDGKILLTLDNGQVWRQQDSDVQLLIEKGATVTVNRAAMGTFRITDKSGRFARFKRVR